MFKCFLTDIKGNILNPFMPNSLKYTLLKFPVERSTYNKAKINYVMIDGYAAVSESKNNLSAPIPFSILKSFCMDISSSDEAVFSVNSFNIYGTSCNNGKNVDIVVEVSTRVCENNNSTIFYAAAELEYKVCYLKAESSQYNAECSCGKKIYTDEDELTEYGSCGILSPDTVSYYSLFINGYIQPQCNYILHKGYFELTTADTPQDNHIISVEFITFKDRYGKMLNTVYNQLVFISDGTKRRFANCDIIPSSSTTEIPDTEKISYWNLYINGVLQPQKNYCIKKGILELLTADTPADGQKIVLEAVTVTNNAGCLVKASVYTFNAVSDGSKVYTDKNEICRYGCRGIISPEKCTCFDLFVNGLLQPKANYHVYEGHLIFTTDDCPTPNDIITLRFIIIIQ